MGLFLNTIAPYTKYKMISQELYFVDKSALIGELLPAIGREQRFYCIVRPRRFGKTIISGAYGLRRTCGGKDAGVCGNGGGIGDKGSDLFCYGGLWVAYL